MQKTIITKRQFIILFLWISSTLLAFSYFVSAQLMNFDEHNKLESIEYRELGSYLSPHITTNKNNKKQTVIHFSTPNCSCQQYSEQHIKDINKLAIKNNFNVKNVVIDDDIIIPSTPSIAIVDKSGDVIYFGPYGQGIACSQTSGYAQTILNNHLKGYTANIIIKEAKGCYCAV